MAKEETMSDDEQAANGKDHQPTVVHPLPNLPINSGPPFIAFSVLLDFAIQKAYQDLTILAELLPKKHDLDRKTSIAQFANSTRQLFVRILAVLKWARCGAKVDMCTGIQCFLDQQAALFVDTADRLFQMCNTTLVTARLPNFQVPTAVDVLTLGTYPRLPAAIKKHFVPPDRITADELASVTRRLNQVIQRRVISALHTLPERLRSFEINNGMVTFRVPGEFEVSLTLLGQLAATPWTLLNFRMLVADPKVTDGCDLLNANQVAFLHHYFQSRLNAAKEPLTELYTLLHSFALSVQLDVLCCQAQRLVNEYLNGNLSIDEYARSQRLVISYWKEPCREYGRRTGYHQSSNYKLIIHVDQDMPDRGLQVAHAPKSDVRLPGMCSKRPLSLEDLLCDTVICRIRHRLGQLGDLIRSNRSFQCSMRGRFPKLCVTLLDDCSDSELLFVSINLFSGKFLVHVAALPRSEGRRQLEEHLNGGCWTELRETLLSIRLELMVNRYERMIVLFHMPFYKTLPLAKETKRLAPESRTLLIRMNQSDKSRIVFHLEQDATKNFKLNSRFVISCPNGKEEALQFSEESVDLEMYNFAHCDRAPGESERQLLLHYEKQVGVLLSVCEREFAFLALMKAFERHGIRYHRQIENNWSSCKIDVVGFDECNGEAVQSFLDFISNITIRLQFDRYKLNWVFEFHFAEALHDHKTIAVTMTKQRQATVANYPISINNTDNAAEEFLNTLRTFAAMSKPYVELVRALSASAHFSNVAIISYTYHKLIFAYGPVLDHVCSLSWRSSDNSFRMVFSIRPGRNNGQAINPHNIINYHLQHWFQKKQHLIALIATLNTTLAPLTALASLSSLVGPHLSDSYNATSSLSHVFCIIPLSPVCVRLVYKARLCLEITVTSDQELSIRDCAATCLGSLANKLMPKYVPIVGLKAFLNLHTSETTRRWSDETTGELAAAAANTPPEDWTPSFVPIVIKHSVLTSLCAPSNTAPKPDWSPMHKFLASVGLIDMFRDQMNMTIPRPGQLCIKVPQLEVRYLIEETSLSYVVAKIYFEDKDYVSEADVQSLERYFNTCIAPLYSYSASSSFVRILTICHDVRRDLLANLVLIMNIQMNRYAEEGVYWLPEICLQVPPVHLLPPLVLAVSKVGQIMNSLAVIHNPANKKILLWIKFTRVDNRSICMAFPLLYDGENNALSIFRGSTQAHAGGGAAPLSAGPLCAVDACLMRQQQVHQNYGDCSFWASIRDVMHTNDLLAPVNG